MPVKNRRSRQRLPVNKSAPAPQQAPPALPLPPPTAEPTTTTQAQPLVTGALPMPGNAMGMGMGMGGTGLPMSLYPTIGEIPAAPMPGVPGQINNQNDLNAMIAQIQRSQNLANQANVGRYQQALEQMQAARQNLTGLYGRAGQYIQDIGQSAARDVNLGAQRTFGGLEQDLVSRGLGNSTVVASIARGVEDDRRRAMERVEEQRRVALGGLSERFAGAQFGATGDIAGLIQSRTDQGPDTGLYSQLAKQAGATNTEKLKGFGGTVQNVPSNPFSSPSPGGGGGGGGSSGGFSQSSGGGGGGSMRGASAAGNNMSGGTYTGPRIPVPSSGSVSVPSARSPLSDQKESAFYMKNTSAKPSPDAMSYEEFARSLGPGMAASLKRSAYQNYLKSKGVSSGGGASGGGGSSSGGGAPAAAPSAAAMGAAAGQAVGSAFGPAGSALGGLAGGAIGGLYQRMRKR